MRLALCSIGLLLAGCAHTVHLDSIPQGARVELDGAFIGQTPLAYVDRAGFGRTYAITLKREGYLPKHVLLTQQVKVPTACCPLLLPWAWELPDDGYTWPLQPDDGAPPPPIPGFIAPP